MEAIVIKNSGSHYYLTCLPQWEPFPAVLRGRIRLKQGSATNPVAVGDRVSYSSEGKISEKNPAVITEVHPRKNYLIRKSTNLSRQAHIIGANLDMAVICVSICFPEIKLPFLDRLLVSCELYKIPVTIILNKVDIYRDFAEENITAFKSIYENAGYRVLETSARTGEGIDTLRSIVKDRICIFSGESGVGKSSLIKALDPTLDPKTGEISEAHLQGKHTTSLYEMYPLGCGGFVIDTPGIRGFGLVDVEKEEVARYFPEMLRHCDDCRFVPCTHTHEPGCAVKAAVESGEISADRYNSYLGMLEEDKKFR